MTIGVGVVTWGNKKVGVVKDSKFTVQQGKPSMTVGTPAISHP